jgi:multidrug efflux system membrane fusion protein
MKKTTALVVAALVLAGAAGGAYWYSHRSPDASQTAGPASGKGGKGKAGAFDPNRAIPVVAEAARKADVNVYLASLGTVVPLKTVVVRSRVEGELVAVHFTEGEMVKAGQLLAEIDPRPFQVQLMQAEGQLARDQALLANARIDLERYQTLFQQDSIARQQVDTQAALVRQYEGSLKTDQSAIASAKLQLDYARINAPIGGRLGLRQVDPGNVVRAGDANGIVVIAQLQPVAAVFTIPQDQIGLVMKNKQPGLEVEAWGRDNQKRIATGTLITLDNQIDVTTGTVKLKAQFANADGALFPNQFVNVRMRVDTLKDQTVVPVAAVQRGAQGLFVYVAKDDGTVTVRSVRVGPTDGPVVAIESGVEAGERVVTDGVDRLREGAKVETGPRPVFDNAKKAENRKGRSKKGGQ